MGQSGQGKYRDSLVFAFREFEAFQRAIGKHYGQAGFQKLLFFFLDDKRSKTDVLKLIWSLVYLFLSRILYYFQTIVMYNLECEKSLKEIDNEDSEVTCVYSLGLFQM